MEVTCTDINYQDGDTLCKGKVFRTDNTPRPVVVIFHAWDGLNQEVIDKATALAQQGYIAFTADVLGNGYIETDPSKLQATLAPFYNDRAMLYRRANAAITAAKTITSANTATMGAMGYCFGGTCVLDLARAGHPELTAAVSFHGGLKNNDLAMSEKISTKLLILHGNDDPMVPPEQVLAFKEEMTSKQADWQFIAYSNTVHGFTRPAANNPEMGVIYNEPSDRRSWQAMLSFFNETL